VLFEVGRVHPSAFDDCRRILDGVPASGNPSPNTGETFTCRVWVKDAMYALNQARMVRLPKSVKDVEQDIVKLANDRMAMINRQDFNRNPAVVAHPYSNSGFGYE
jgi:hypothetical protein